MSVGIILVGAGSGTRLGAGIPKTFVPVAGEIMLARALRGCLSSPELAAVSVVVPAGRRNEAEILLRGIIERTPDIAVSLVEGGATRALSVAAGLNSLPETVEIVLVHDAARALTPTSVFARVIHQVRETGHGVIPVVPLVDTVKVIEADRSVVGSPPRSELAAVQTPQAFPRDMLLDAYARATQSMTDDAGTVAAAGYPVSTVDGDALAFKITAPEDLSRAEYLLLAPLTSTESRTGTGMDAHRFRPGAPLWLAGLHWPDEPGLAGHSDGDVVSHALCDALLGAAGLGDIGGLFGTDDPRYAAAHGDVFLKETVRRIQEAGWSVQNCSVQLIAERPRLAGRRREAEERLSEWVGAPVNLAATTTDGMGFTGSGEGAVAIASALLVRPVDTSGPNQSRSPA